MKIKYKKDYMVVYHADENIEGVHPKIDAYIDVSVEDLKFFKDTDWDTYRIMRNKLRKVLEAI
jgi:hypothetical protein